MRVCLFRDLRQEKWTSIEVYADRLFDGLQRINAPGWSFDALRPADLHIPGLPTASLYLNRGLRYPYYARSRQGSINHVLDNSYGHLVHFLDRRRTVVTSHGGTPRTWRRWNREGPAMWFFDWAFSGMLKAARIIVVSEYSKRELLTDYDYDPECIHVVHHGVDESYAPLDDEHVQEIRRRFTCANEKGLILHVGHCAARKNIEVLLSAFGNLLQDSDHPYRLLQIGGQFTERQQRLIDRLGVASRITQVAHVPSKELAAMYNAATVFVFPSLYEGFGVPLIEAMACGTPIVCSDFDLFHEVCGDAALYVDTVNYSQLAEAIGRALNDIALRTTLRQRGLLRARRFSWQRCSAKTLAVYQSLSEQ
jgi:glycosyltransferase involved in cell wall biosynthesis